jgi:hypothetical protein
MLGKVIEEFGYCSIDVYKMVKMEMIGNPVG